MGKQLVEVVKLLDTVVPDQVIAVSKISQDRIQQRLVDSDLRHPQMAEQLVEVPTVLSFALLQQRIAEQFVDNPVPCGRGRRLQGFHPGHGSTAPQFAEQIVDIPVPAEGLQGSRPGQVSTASSSFSRSTDEAFQRVFRTFPCGNKSARVAGQVSAQLGEHVSSSTLRAHQLARAGVAAHLSSAATGVPIPST